MSENNEVVWVWCLHCERCYPSNQFRKVKPDRQMRNMGFTDDLEMCHYPDCDGDHMFDGHSWEGIRAIHPDYPEVPEMGVVYGMY